MSTPKDPKPAPPATTIREQDIIVRKSERRSFLSMLGVAGLVTAASTAVAACTDTCDADRGDPPMSDSDVSRFDSDPFDAVESGDPIGSASDYDTGDSCDSD